MRFIVKDHGIRGLKDAMSRDILRALDEAGIGIASAFLDRQQESTEEDGTEQPQPFLLQGDK